MTPRPIIAVHGGAGTRATPANRRALEAAARRGARFLGRGALEAVVEAVAALEASGRFNAGVGSYLDLDGVPRMDASVMASDGRWGAVASVPWVRSPVRLARTLLEATGHALIAGEPALDLARGFGLGAGFPVPGPRRELWRRFRAEVRGGPRARLAAARRLWEELYGPSAPGGTVGAVALDARGALAAATSTGGLAVKIPGRVGDSAVIGAGTFASPAAAASATGVGEAILRAGTARLCVGAAARIGAPRAAAAAVRWLAEETGSCGALLAVDRAGRVGRAPRNLLVATASVTRFVRGQGSPSAIEKRQG